MEKQIRKLYVEAYSRCNLACKMCFRRIREFAERFGADDLNLSHIIPNRAQDIEQALWPMCDVAAIKGVTDKLGYTWRFEGFDMGTEILMFKFSQRY